MAQGYYTLEEAADLLGISVDELKLQARRGDIRSFQDRGTWRFRVQDIQELARQKGLGSEPDLVLGESLAPVPKKKTSGLKRDPSPQEKSDTDDESVGIGKEDLKSGSSAKGSGKSVPRTPEPGSDSDVRLVNDDLDFGIELDSDVRVSETPPPSKSSSKSKRSSKLGSQRRRSEVDVSPPDSGVRLVPMDSDSDVRIAGADDSDDDAVPIGEDPPKSASDSDIRLEFDESGEHDETGMITDEVDLDAELKKHQETQGQKSSPAAPSQSPFELSDTDYGLPSTGSSIEQEAGPGPGPDSSDFELTPTDESASPIEPGSEEFEVQASGEQASDEVDLGSSEGPSGGMMKDPVDSGISLEQESEGSDEFELSMSLEEDGSEPAEVQADESSSEFELTFNPDDSSSEEMLALEESSEFELTLDAEDSSESSPVTSMPEADESSSEFELTIDADESSSEFELTIDADDESGDMPDLGSDSEFELQIDDADMDSGSSEFELTIDDDMGLVEDESGTAQLELDDDVVETDLDDSVLLDEDESGSEVVALEEDADLIDSDFDIDIEVDEESSSQVVALEEESDFLEEEPIGAKGDEFDDFDQAPGLDFDEDFEAEADLGPREKETVIVERDVHATPWSALPVVVLLPCVIVMFLVGLMGFELVQSTSGYKEPGTITKAVGNLLGQKFDK